MKRIKLSFNSPLFLIILGLLVLQSCKKNDQNNPDTKPPILAKIIDWEAANANKDTVPEFTIQYNGDKITSLTGKYGEYMTLQHDQNPAGFSSYYSYPTHSRIVRIRKRHPALLEYIDTLEFKSGSFDTLQGVAFTSSPSYHIFFQEQANGTRKFISPFNAYYSGDIEVDYNNKGDVSSILYQRQWEANLEVHTVEVNYTSAENTLSKVYKRLDVIDPSALNSLIDLLSPGKNASYYPFSIHYGSNCISTFKITTVWYYNGQESSREGITHNVSYEKDNIGYITKILIDNKPFKEFVYQ